ncbi:MAG: hypothetical protein PWP46_2088 [Fusobacteriaceae bacterium]|jgi:exo-beta-1,3-glucanase (GH17 family)|nr:glycosyl hydrolase [Fusobacteriales bacterium]MDN5305201.1 hypothetical protein [Fusobacteriaceae bacterium]
MTLQEKFNIEHKNAICYSGYRKGQKPGGEIPTYEQVKEDLILLSKNWSYLRLYDTSRHPEMVLEVIEKEKLDFKVLIGAYIIAEVNNPNCPWGGVYSKEVLEENKKKNEKEIEKAIELANKYPNIVMGVSVGNEATVEWNDHMVPVERVIEFAKKVKKNIKQPVTFCENYVPWTNKLEKLAEVVDFISIHTYPLWEYKSINQALDFTKENYYSVANKYPNTPIVITEAGWTTNSNGRGMDKNNANEDLQERYYNELMEWTNQNKILTFVFEAFDEEWKGSNDPLEPEKHWGLFTIDRKPKKVMKNLYK